MNKIKIILGLFLLGLIIESCNPDNYEVENFEIGSILCTDGSVVSVKKWPIYGKTAKGVVFYIDETQSHGWAVDLNNLGNYQWGKENINISSLNDVTSAIDASKDLKGYDNTDLIRNFGCSSQFPAANCMNFYNGWYLPACGQLKVLVENINTINASFSILNDSGILTRELNSCWWSSTETSDSRAWYVMYNGTQRNGLKCIELSARAVCDF